MQPYLVIGSFKLCGDYASGLRGLEDPKNYHP